MVAQATAANPASHSVQGQDLWVVNDVYHGKRGGWFVEAGAVDGVFGSNTCKLERAFGWTGLCVEPVPQFYEALKNNRTCRSFHCCLNDTATEVTFIVNHSAMGTSSMSATLPENLRRLFYHKESQTQTIKLPARPLADLLREADAPKFIEYLSLDIEGAEDVVLKSFPFNEFTFGCMTIERGSPKYGQLQKQLKRHGYRKVRVAAMDDHYVHESVPYSIPLHDRLYMLAHAAASRLKKFLRR